MHGEVHNFFWGGGLETDDNSSTTNSLDITTRFVVRDVKGLIFLLKFQRSVVCFLLGDSPASEFYMPTFRNTLSVPSS